MKIFIIICLGMTSLACSNMHNISLIQGNFNSINWRCADQIEIDSIITKQAAFGSFYYTKPVKLNTLFTEDSVLVEKLLLQMKLLTFRYYLKKLDEEQVSETLIASNDELAYLYKNEKISNYHFLSRDQLRGEKYVSTKKTLIFIKIYLGKSSGIEF